jgi:hypothetical protein
MKESYDEGLASHIGPESCVDVPRGRSEALTGGSTGGLLSSENTFFWRPSQWPGAKATRDVTLCESHTAPAESKNLACADISCAGIGIPRKGV